MTSSNEKEGNKTEECGHEIKPCEGAASDSGPIKAKRGIL